MVPKAKVKRWVSRQLLKKKKKRKPSGLSNKPGYISPHIFHDSCKGAGPSVLRESMPIRKDSSDRLRDSKANEISSKWMLKCTSSRCNETKMEDTCSCLCVPVKRETIWRRVMEDPRTKVHYCNAIDWQQRRGLPS